MKKVAIVSTIITSNIKHQLANDTEAVIFDSIDHFIETIEEVPVRFDKVVITEDIFAIKYNYVMTLLYKYLNDEIIRTDKVILLETTESIQNSIRFYNEEYPDVEPLMSIVKVRNLNQTATASIINGIEGTAQVKVKEEIIVRSKRTKAAQLHNELSSIQEETKDNRINQLKNKITPEIMERGKEQLKYLNETHTVDNQPRIMHIAGLADSMVRETTIVLSKYLANMGKTLLIDTDRKVYGISVLASLDQDMIEYIPFQELLVSMVNSVNRISTTDKKLIILALDADSVKFSKNALDYLYSAIIRLCKDIKYVLIYDHVDSIADTLNPIVTINNNILSMVETFKEMSYLPDNASFIIMDNSIKETRIFDNMVARDTIKLLYGDRKFTLDLVKVETLERRGALDDFSIIV